MKHVVLLLACLAIMPSGVQAGELFRWMDKAGEMNYGDVPPADATNVEIIKPSGQPTQNEDLPFETRLAQQKFPVTLYVGAGCGETCNQARSLLSKRGIPYSEKLLRTKQDIEEFKQLSGIDGEVPVLAVGRNFLKGFLESQWNSELDIAGYPKTAPYRASSIPAASQVAPANPKAQ
jgi:hypothetical protein